MNIIFQVEGGLGKSIMATAMIKVIKKRYKNSHLVVVTGFQDVFLNNPDVSAEQKQIAEENKIEYIEEAIENRMSDVRYDVTGFMEDLV